MSNIKDLSEMFEVDKDFAEKIAGIGARVFS